MPFYPRSTWWTTSLRTTHRQRFVLLLHGHLSGDHPQFGVQRNPRAADCERVIGTLRRECFDHVIVVHEAHARRLLREYLAHYHDDRTHPAWTRTARADAPWISILALEPRSWLTPEWVDSITATPGSARPDAQKEPRRPGDAGRRERGLLRKTKIGNSPTLPHGPWV